MADDNGSYFYKYDLKELYIIENEFFFIDLSSSTIGKRLRSQLQLPNILLHWLFTGVSLLQSPENVTTTLVIQILNIKEFWYSKSPLFGLQTVLLYAQKQMTPENKLANNQGLSLHFS